MEIARDVFPGCLGMQILTLREVKYNNSKPGPPFQGGHVKVVSHHITSQQVTNEYIHTDSPTFSASQVRFIDGHDTFVGQKL